MPPPPPRDEVQRRRRGANLITTPKNHPWRFGSWPYRIPSIDSHTQNHTKIGTRQSSDHQTHRIRRIRLKDQGKCCWTLGPFPGLVNFVPAVAYHFCLNLPAAFSQPGNGLIAQPCKFVNQHLQIEIGEQPTAKTIWISTSCHVTEREHQCHLSHSLRPSLAQWRCENFRPRPSFPYGMRRTRPPRANCFGGREGGRLPNSKFQRSWREWG